MAYNILKQKDGWTAGFVWHNATDVDYLEQQLQRQRHVPVHLHLNERSS
jgi:hypothetical protein